MPRRGVRCFAPSVVTKDASSGGAPSVAPARPRVIVSLTTVPERAARVAPMITNFLQRQTQPPDLVVLHLPHRYADPKLGECRALPLNLAALVRQDCRVRVHRCDDLGPGTKLAGLATARNLLWPTDVVVYLDDDHAYHPKTVERHALAHAVFPKTVFCTRGSMISYGSDDPTFARMTRSVVVDPPMTLVDVPEGCGSVSLVAGDLDLRKTAAKISKSRLGHPALFYSDDVALGNCFWAAGLSVRLLPAPAPPLGAFRHSRDASALMTGQGLTIETTGERIRTAIRALGTGRALPGLGPVLVHDRADPVAALAAGMVPVEMDHTPLPPPDTRDLALVVFAFSRPDYFERTLRSIRASNRCYAPQHTYVFVDGVVNPHSGRACANADDVRQCSDMARHLLGPQAHVWSAACNYGVALMQHYGMHRVFAELGYKAAVLLEDDMVLGRDYLGSVAALLPTLGACPQLSAAQGGYRRSPNAYPNDLLLLDAREAHVHYWGWLTTKSKHEQIARDYAAATLTLFGSVDYALRNQPRGKARVDAVGAWFAARGIEPTYRSQDWVRDACFRRVGMTHKLVCARRRAAPIGERGLHCNPALFKKLGLDASTDDIHTSPELDPTLYRLLTNARVLPNVPPAVAWRLVNSGDVTPPTSVVVCTPSCPPVPLTQRAVVVGGPLPYGHLNAREAKLDETGDLPLASAVNALVHSVPDLWGAPASAAPPKAN